MRSERGQATVEWVGIVLLVALALAALAHLAPKADGRALGSSVARSVTHPLVRPAGSAAVHGHLPSDRAFPIPPLIPRAGGSPALGHRLSRARDLLPRARDFLPRVRTLLPRARILMHYARAGAGHAWRRAWIACLVYERFRYALMHPESRLPGHTIPPSEVLRMVNDCISPFDLVRDWPLVRGQ